MIQIAFGSNKFKYFLHMFVQMYHIATSKVVILDSYCIVVSILNSVWTTAIQKGSIIPFINSKLTNYKHIKNLIITDEPMIKTSTGELL